MNNQLLYAVSFLTCYIWAFFCISEAELPKISVSANRTVKHNSRVEIACNLTEGKEADTTSLERISWYKNGELFKHVRLPDPDKTEDTLKPLYIQSAGVRDAGVYTCVLEVVLHEKNNYTISKSMELRSKNILFIFLLRLPFTSLVNSCVMNEHNNLTPFCSISTEAILNPFTGRCTCNSSQTFFNFIVVSGFAHGNGLSLISLFGNKISSLYNKSLFFLKSSQISIIFTEI